jgi:sporulation protein YlmC with PRC-barrel domain
MDTDFRVGAAVDCTDGPAGKLQQLVLDPVSESITHLVVESQHHFGIPLLVPLKNVARADQERVVLNCTQAELKQMEPFEEVMSPGIQGQQGLPGMPPSSMSPAPGLGGTAMEGLVGPLAAPPFSPPMVQEVVPQGEVVIGRDAAVTATDGDIGHVDDLVTDPGTGRLTHLVVRSGHLWARHTFRLPASAVAAVEEGIVRLRLSRDEVEAIARQDDDTERPAKSAVSVGEAPKGSIAGGAAVPDSRDTGVARAVQADAAPARVVRPPAPAGVRADEDRRPTIAGGAGGRHVVGLFATRQQAEDGIDALIAGGFPSDSLSAVTSEGKELNFPTAGEERLDQGTRNTAIGAVVGAIAGFAIFGPLLVIVGAVAGGLVGLLTALGATPQQAEYLSERVRAGHYMVVVHPNGREAEAVTLLENAGARDIHQVGG